MSRLTGVNMMATLFLPVFSLVIWSGVVYGDEATLTLRGRLAIVNLDYPRTATSQRKGARRDESHYMLHGSDGSHWQLHFAEGVQLPYSGLALEVQVPARQTEATENMDQFNSSSSSLRRNLASGLTRATSHGSGISHPLRHSRRMGPLSEHHSRQLQSTTLARSDDKRLTVVSWRVLSPDELGVDPETRTDSLDAPTRDFEYNDESMIMDDVSTVIFILDMCGRGPATTKEELERMLFQDEFLNMQSYLSSCSNNIAKLRPEHVLILGPVAMPCDGTSFGEYWRATACDLMDYYGWQYYVEEWAVNNGYGDYIRGFRHRVVVTSPGQSMWMVDADVDCSWTGLGTIGPAGSDYEFFFSGPTFYWPGVYGYAWISGDYWREPTSWIHELAHNYYLGHAGGGSDEYGDSTCPMGLCCTPRCFNAPHMWQLGWADPVWAIDESELPPGRTIDVMLHLPRPDPYTASSVASTSVRVSTTWTSAGDESIWVAYREARPPFDNLPEDLPRNVSIYVSKGQLPSLQTGRTTRLADLAPGLTWRTQDYSLVVGWVGVFADDEGLTVQVKICRYLDFAGQEYSCWDTAGHTTKDGGLVVGPGTPLESPPQPPLPPSAPTLPTPLMPPPNSPPPPPPSQPDTPLSPLPTSTPLSPSNPSGPNLPSPPPSSADLPNPPALIPSQPSIPLAPGQPTPPGSPDAPSTPLPGPESTSPPQSPIPSQPSVPLQPGQPARPDFPASPIGPELPNRPLPPAHNAPLSSLHPVSPHRPSAHDTRPLEPSSPSLPTAVYSRDVPIGPLRPAPPHSPNRAGQQLGPSQTFNPPLGVSVSYPPTPSAQTPSGIVMVQSPTPASRTPARQNPNPSVALYPPVSRPLHHLHVTTESSPPVYGAPPPSDELLRDT